MMSPKGHVPPWVPGPTIGDALSLTPAALDTLKSGANVCLWMDEAPDVATFAAVLYALAHKTRVFMGFPTAVLSAHSALFWAHSVTVLAADTEADCQALCRWILHHDTECVIRGGYTANWPALLRKCESPIEERLLLHLLARSEGVGDVDAQELVGRFRIDITARRGSKKVAVECDGHNFHERTKEQAQRDKSRDRALSAQNWTVLRFTGSEIWADPARCAQEIIELLLAEAESA